MSSGAAPNLPPLKLHGLKFESDILHLIFHRGKNAHHCNGWWKWLGMLRRSIGKLLDYNCTSGLQARLEYMRSVIVPGCYRAFTSLVAGTHMAPLGLTLLAILARVHKIIRAERKEIEEEGEEVAQEEMVVEAPEGVKVNGAGLVVGPLTIEDFGETIPRDKKEEEEEEEEEEEKEESEGEDTVVPEKEVVITAKENEVATQEVATTSKVLLKRKRKNQGGFITKAVEKEEETVTKKRKKVIKVALRPPSPSPPPPPRTPAMKEPTIIRSKRKSEGVKKKKKRKKGDEIDDLFAGLL